MTFSAAGSAGTVSRFCGKITGKLPITGDFPAHCGLRTADLRARLAGFPDLEKAIYRLRKEWKADLVIVEKAGSGLSVGQNIRRADQRNFWLQALAPVGSKQDRASQQTPKFERGEILLPDKAPWLRTFEEELLSFPHARNDDQVDSAVQFLAALDTGNLLRFANGARRR